MTRTLDELRARIDSIDASLLELLEERASVAAEVAEAKRREGRVSFYDPARERELTERLSSRSDGTLPTSAIRSIWREIIAACLAVQRPLTVAHLGPEGTFTGMAARHLFGDSAVYRPVATIDTVFHAIAHGDATRGVVPVENSTEGTVGATVRGLLASDLRIERELVLPIHYSLATHAPSLAAVRRVYSHPQALGQCGDWIRRHLPDAELVPRASTAAAAGDVGTDAEGAALLSERAAQVHGLPCIAANIADDPGNATRFLVISTQDSALTGNDRTSLAFELPDRPGALREALLVFEAEGVNLTHLESHPCRRRAWAWTFVCDLEGHRDDPPVAAAIEALGTIAEDVRCLGSYPRHSSP
ncbi:MAG: prephenate dehydratase [Deltaproteobacteria bacterium]|nr:MAG: prephenate dehydratase [Deltaproteobacteria bacterium]